MGIAARLQVVLVTLVAGFFPLAATAASTGPTLAREVVVKVSELRTEVSMMVYDETTEEYRQQTRKLLTALDAPMQAAIKELNARDATAAAGIAESWRVMQGSLLGGRDSGAGLLNTDYDSKVHGDFDTGCQTVASTLDKAWKLSDKSAAPEARAELLAARLVANYTQVAGAPFGSYTLSANSDDSDLGKGVAEMNAVLDELDRKYAQDKDKSAKLKRINAKWQFIRTTILKAGKQATPFIVYKHGGDIVRDLASLGG